MLTIVFPPRAAGGRQILAMKGEGAVFGKHGDSFDPATLAKLQRAFDEAWKELVAANSPLTADEVQEATRSLMAARIFTTANQGITDHDTLRQVALGQLQPKKPAAGR